MTVAGLLIRTHQQTSTSPLTSASAEFSSVPFAGCPGRTGTAQPTTLDRRASTGKYQRSEGPTPKSIVYPQALSHYSFKPSPYSSHAIVLSLFPAVTRTVRVLDAGCGNGYLAAILASRGYDVTGVEQPGGFDKDFPANVRLVPADLESGLPDLDGTFDYILCADVLEHLRHPEGLLAQLRACLAPGGVLIASLPNSGNIYFRLTVLAGRFPQEDKGLFDRTHLRFYTLDGWRQLFAGSGYEWEQLRPTGIPIGLRFPGAQESLPVRAAERLSYLLARLRKQLFAYQFVVVAKPYVRP